VKKKMKKKMKKILLILAVFGLILGFSGLAMAADNVNQTVTFSVSAINEISVSGNPAPMAVSTATAGSEPNQVADSTTTYNITTNGTGKKITGALSADMPSNVTLKVNLTAPTGGTSQGDVILELTGGAKNLVTGITQKAESSLGITYKLSATVLAVVVALDTRTVTLTVADAT
jgi:cytoskeletal protein RodZ